MSETEYPKPDWGRWRKSEHRLVNIKVAIALFLDIDPYIGNQAEVRVEDLEPGFTSPTKPGHVYWPDFFCRRWDFARHAISTGKLEYSGVPELYDPYLNVDLRDFARWCAREGLEAPPEFLYLAEGNTTTAAPYLDPGHPGYAPELHAAIEAWMAVHVGGYGPASRQASDKIKAWLEANHKEIQQTGRERLARVCNPADRKRGGAPKNPSTGKLK